MSQHDPLFQPGDGCVSSAAGEVTPTYTIPKTIMRTPKIKRDDLNKTVIMLIKGERSLHA